MRKLIFKSLLAALLGLVAAVSSNAQCINQEFAYEFCDPNNPGRTITKCSWDPHREPGLIPMRQQEPPCYVPAKTYDEKMEITGFPGPQIIEVFDPSQSYADMNEAWNEWVTLCPVTSGGPPPSAYCCIKVYLSRNYFDFRDAVNDPVAEGLNEIDSRTCRIRCDFSPQVFFNFTDDFLWGSRDIETEPMEYVYFTGRISPRENYTGLSARYVMSFRQHFQNMMGQMLGARVGVGAPCEARGRVISDAISEDNAAGLTDADKCHFQKLYCPDAVGLEPALSVEKDEIINSLSLNVVPNPATSELRMNFSRPIMASGATLRLINATGETVMEQPVEKETQELSINVEHLANGWYMLVLAADDVIFAKKVLIEE